jgi:hypothetical protein
VLPVALVVSSLASKVRWGPSFVSVVCRLVLTTFGTTIVPFSPSGRMSSMEGMWLPLFGVFRLDFIACGLRIVAVVFGGWELTRYVVFRLLQFSESSGTALLFPHGMYPLEDSRQCAFARLRCLQW